MRRGTGRAPMRTTTIFTKEPVPGRVKTRLVPLLRAEEAAALALAMLDDTIAKCSNESGFETLVCIAPPSALPWVRARCAATVRLAIQHGEGLGERLAHHCETELACGERTLVVIGSDAPHVPVEVVLEAHARLEAGVDVVLGLDDGGGYHLIGMRRAHTRLFRDVTMSAPDMAGRTIALARALDLSVGLVTRGFDVDEPADLERLAGIVRADPALAARVPRTAAWIAAWRERAST